MAASRGLLLSTGVIDERRMAYDVDVLELSPNLDARAAPGARGAASRQPTADIHPAGEGGERILEAEKSKENVLKLHYFFLRLSRRNGSIYRLKDR
jgi:hypothetical protein